MAMATPTPNETLLGCRALRVGYHGRALLPAIDVALGRGEFWVVIGRNGSGKTTWFRTLLGLLRPVEGSVIRAQGVRLAYVPQQSRFDEIFPLSTKEVVEMGAERGWSFLRPRARARERVERALVIAGVGELSATPFRELSEGQKQRVLLARLAAGVPDVALLDEPTAAMDELAEREAFELLDRLRRELGMTVVVVSHYLEIAREFATAAIGFDRAASTVVVGDPERVFADRSVTTCSGERIVERRDE
jgi:zinc transport system ATP-binding protein